jgi:hypothetical protein
MKNPGGTLPSGMPLALLVVGSIGLACLSGDSIAQDSHYWDNQYGTRAELLGGLVVGSSADLSASFYNPGWIALRNEASLLLTTKAAEVYRITLDNEERLTDGPSSRTIASSPGYLAGRFSNDQDEGWKWVYSYLEKVKFVYDASAVVIDWNPEPGPEDFSWQSGEAFRISRVNEYWYGLSVARKIRNNLAIGFSPYIAHRTQDSRAQVTGEVLDAQSVYSAGHLVDDFKFWHIRFLMKMGLAWQGERWSAGFTVTTPSLGVMGQGSVYQNLSFSGDYDDSSPGVDPPFLQVNQQESLDSFWKSPLSLAWGAGLSFNRTKIHVTAEWFNQVGQFKVLDPAPYEIVSRPGQYDQYRLESGARQVFNYGAAADHRVSQDFSLFASYRTDQSTLPDNRDRVPGLAVWDLNHVTGGASFRFLSLEFTTGLQYSWGSGNSDLFAGFRYDEEGNIIDRLRDRQLNYDRLKILFGFNLPFSRPDDED